MELVSPAGEAVLFTNPIWFWPAEDEALVPDERRPRPLTLLVPQSPKVHSW
jgi:hypothetical protein